MVGRQKRTKRNLHLTRYAEEKKPTRSNERSFKSLWRIAKS